MRRFFSVVVGLAVLALGCATAPSAAPTIDSLDVDLGEVGDFSLTDQEGRTVRREDLAGKVWVASFIFTRCATECVQITRTLGKLQDRLGHNGDVMLVSFTVDPEHDTRAVLNKFARQKEADSDRWLFLTGEREPLYRLIVASFKQGVARRAKPGSKTEYEVGHSSRLVVVDHEGRIRGYVDGTREDELPRLGRKLQWLILARYHYLPTVNAVLNGLCGILLILGFAAIRRRWVSAHKVLMLAALAVSAAFLACYLYYHFVVLGGHPSGFPGRGWIRPVYLAVLISHTLLAVAVGPLALITAYRGLRNQLARHVRIARWTLPIWLYVSVTGVLVYWMRYHLYP